MSLPILMPQLGAAADEAVLVRWLVSAGDSVVPGQPLYEVESDKALVTVEAADAGVMGRLRVQEGETVTVGTRIGTLLAPGEVEEVKPEPAAEDSRRS